MNLEKLHHRILSALRRPGALVDSVELAQQLSESPTDVNGAIDELVMADLVSQHDIRGLRRYRITAEGGSATTTSTQPQIAAPPETPSTPPPEPLPVQQPSRAARMARPISTEAAESEPPAPSTPESPMSKNRAPRKSIEQHAEAVLAQLRSKSQTSQELQSSAGITSAVTFSAVCKLLLKRRAITKASMRAPWELATGAPPAKPASEKQRPAVAGRALDAPVATALDSLTARACADQRPSTQSRHARTPGRAGREIDRRRPGQCARRPGAAQPVNFVINCACETWPDQQQRIVLRVHTRAAGGKIASAKQGKLHWFESPHFWNTQTGRARAWSWVEGFRTALLLHHAEERPSPTRRASAAQATAGTPSCTKAS